jgi:GNAT superfamily N-acetyltransferase
MSDASIDRLRACWMQELGCRPADFMAGLSSVCAHGTLAGYSGVIAFRHAGACVVSAPQERVAPLRAALAGLGADEIFNEGRLRAALGASVERVIGPAWIGGLAASDFRPAHGTSTRPLETATDWQAFDTFLERCPPIDVELSSLEAGRAPTVATFEGPRIAAAASFELREGILAHIGILTDPELRGRGYGRQAISLIAELALAAGYGLQYQTLRANRPSVAAARALGFADFAETLALRLRP